MYKLAVNQDTTTMSGTAYALLNKTFSKLADLKAHVSKNAHDLEGIFVSVEKIYRRPIASRSPYTHAANGRVEASTSYIIINGALKRV